MPVSLDEYPIHQTPLSMRYVASSDRNFYDRCYFNAHDRTGEIFLITGAGIYPQLGVKDAYAVVRRGDLQHVIRASDALDDERLNLAIGPYRIEVVEPLQRIRLVCDADSAGIGFDLTWQGSFPAIDEERHILRDRDPADRRCLALRPARHLGGRAAGRRRDASPSPPTPGSDRATAPGGSGRSATAEPAGRPADDPNEFGFWWLYVPIRFDDYAIVLIAQEDGDGYRTLNDAVRVRPDGRVEQLGWPRVTISYRSGTRIPEHARIELTEPDGSPLVMEVDALARVPLHVGCGYGGDPDWTHGQWRGRGLARGRDVRLHRPGGATRARRGASSTTSAAPPATATSGGDCSSTARSAGTCRADSPTSER